MHLALPGVPVNRLDIDWLTDSLAIGGRFPADATAELAGAHGVGCVVDLRAEACDDEIVLRRHGLSFLYLPTADTRALTPAVLRGAVAWVSRALNSGARVLIHCEYGIGRSPLLALCVLVDRGLDPLAAMNLIKDTRAVTSPSPEQLQAFLEFLRHRQASDGARWSIPSFEALAAIAYRHLAGAAGRGTAAPAR
jgi:hypothetical protein